MKHMELQCECGDYRIFTQVATGVTSGHRRDGVIVKVSITVVQR